MALKAVPLQTTVEPKKPIFMRLPIQVQEKIHCLSLHRLGIVLPAIQKTLFPHMSGDAGKGRTDFLWRYPPAEALLPSYKYLQKCTGECFADVQSRGYP